MTRVLLTICLFLLSFTAGAASPFTFKGSEGALIGVYIADLKSGKTLAAYNSSKALVPASVQKCVTAASSQVLLKNVAPFTTRAEIRGRVVDGILEGNLCIVGAGDPTLGSRHFKERGNFASALAGWLRGAGVDSIAGDVIIDENGYPAIGVSPYWLLEDTAWEYGAGLYGINYRDNSFSMTFRRGQDPDIAYVDVVDMLKPGPKNNVCAMRAEGSDILTLSGTLSSESYTSRYSMPVPALALYDDIVAELCAGGIGIGGVISDDVEAVEDVLAYASPLRDDILKVMMFKSDNLFAEGMLRALIGASDYKTFENGIDREKRLWTDKGIDLSSTRWLDGSGLAPVNRMSPRTLGAILEYMAGSPDLSKRYVRLFPLAGKEGTVRSLLAKTRLAGKLALKSGSMNGVLCYAGYKLGEGGAPSHVVVVMVNGATCGSAEIRASIGRYLLSIF